MACVSSVCEPQFTPLPATALFPRTSSPYGHMLAYASLARQVVELYINPFAHRSPKNYTYLLAITELKLSVDHLGSAALHSADRSWIESPSGASAGQFLLDYIAQCATFSLMRKPDGKRLKKKVWVVVGKEDTSICVGELAVVKKHALL
jgi:hypothetical protein